MSKLEIRESQHAYATATRRGREAGFDLVTVSGSEAASVVQRFLMPFYNQRTDEYGGSFENRARFWLETLELVREAVGATPPWPRDSVSTRSTSRRWARGSPRRECSSSRWPTTSSRAA